MRSSAALAVLLFAVLFCVGDVLGRSGSTPPPDHRTGGLPVVESDGILHSTSSTRSSPALASAAADTFDLYGGPSRRLRDPDGIPGTGDEYVEGRFEDASGERPRGLGPGAGDWTGDDRTDVSQFWHVDTFNAANLGDRGSGNHAMWSGLPAGTSETAGWSTPPGYGNRVNDVLLYESEPLADPGAGQTVRLDFVFNLDTEPGHDFVHVEYDSAGTWVGVLELSGTNRDPVTGRFPPPGLRFTDVVDRSIVYTGKDYGGDDGDRIRIRIRFESDGGWSDEDGFFDGDGAVQIDDVVLRTSQGAVVEDFEGPGPYLFAAEPDPIAGDFSAVLGGLRDVDPCATNTTPQLSFVDFGQAVPNGPGLSGLDSTGGSVSERWGYALPGGWVVNHTGGLDGVPVDMAARSPAFDWDLPGAEDDGPDVVGAFLRFDVYRHNPLTNGIFYNWGVRARVDGVWGDWRNFSAAYYSEVAEYHTFTADVTDLIPAGVEQVQILLRCYDWARAFGFAGIDATPAPLYDNVRFGKVRIGGISLSARVFDLANDAFPVSGGIDATDRDARDALDVRFDMARDVNSGESIVPGDSIVFDARAVIPGTTIQDLRVLWALRPNPIFENAIRSTPARPEDENVVVDASGIWTGEVVADSARGRDGRVSEGTFFVDLPDEDFLHPGDVLHYHVRAVDGDGRVTTLPRDLTGFGQWDSDGRSAYDRTWTVRALPSILGTDGAQPSILVHDDAGREPSTEPFRRAFDQLGLFEGEHYDTFVSQGAWYGVSNGLGSAASDTPLGDRRGHGAKVGQISGYSTILYLSGERASRLLSDGSGTFANDKSPDLQLLTAWKEQPGRRGIAHFGDAVASAIAAASPVVGAAYVAGSMGVVVVATDVRPAIGGATAPRVRRLDAPPADDVVAYGGCPGLETFDHLSPGPGAVRTHGFVDPGSGSVVANAAAGVGHRRELDGHPRVDLTFPFAFSTIRDPVARAVDGVSARARFLESVLQDLGAEFEPADPVTAPSVRQPSLTVWPNPFNPSTTVHFVLPRSGVDARVEVFDVAGRRVRVLHSGVATTAELRLRWDGRDGRGRGVSSGVYLVRASAADFQDTRKTVLAK
jgi:hypothetical protein